MPTKWERGRFSPYTSHVIGGEDKDSQRRCIIVLSWVLHLPAGYSCIRQGLQQNTKFNIIILWLGKTNKAEFLFSQQYIQLAKFILQFINFVLAKLWTHHWRFLPHPEHHCYPVFIIYFPWHFLIVPMCVPLIPEIFDYCRHYNQFSCTFFMIYDSFTIYFRFMIFLKKVLHFIYKYFLSCAQGDEK